MNGEIYQLCSIVTSAKNALLKNNTENTNIDFKKIYYERNITFRFCYEHRGYTAKNVEEWYKKCLSLNISDIKCLMPISTDNRAFLGFSNSCRGSIVCFFENNITYFVPSWSFDNGSWDIEYQEYIWENAPKDTPHFNNNEYELMNILEQIGQFACDIGEAHWKKVFDKSISILNGTYDFSNETSKLPPLKLPNDKICLFEAASNADVFGAMGSWNDTPPYSAHEHGMDKEYDSYSDELLKQIRLAILYAINEW